MASQADHEILNGEVNGSVITFIPKSTKKTERLSCVFRFTKDHKKGIPIYQGP